MRRVFVDSAFWIALRHQHDPNHVPARKIARWLLENRCILVVTPFIFAETQAFFCRLPQIRQTVIRDFWENRSVEFEQSTYQDQEQAVQILRRHRDKSYSFADAVSFVVMKRLGLQEVVTFDRHFYQFGGFVVIDGSKL